MGNYFESIKIEDNIIEISFENFEATDI